MRRSVKRPRFVVPFAKAVELSSHRKFGEPTSADIEDLSKKESVPPNKNSQICGVNRSVNQLLNMIDDNEKPVSTKNLLKTNPLLKDKENKQEKELVTSFSRVPDFKRKHGSSVLEHEDDPVACDDGIDDAAVEEDDNHVALTTEKIFAMNSVGKDKQVSEHALYFSVVWCKRSAKKHKKWEGDAVLVVKSRSAILKDLDGKVIARGIGYKVKEVTALEEGSKFFIGGKECEIQGCIPEDEYMSGKCFQDSPSQPVTTTQCIPSYRKFRSPFSTSLNALDKRNTRTLREPTRDPAALYMPRPNALHQWNCNVRQLPVTDVKVDSFLAKHLRLHQKEGVIFMYECIMGFKNSNGHGVILGEDKAVVWTTKGLDAKDEMGLGKTLQCISLIWMLHHQGPYGGKPVLKKIVIITPSSLVKNWQSEFYKWLGKERTAIFAVGQDRKVEDFIHSNYSVLIISYEMYVRKAELLSSVKFDLVICDEGHRLKNLNIKTSGVIMNLPTKRRILLTGTPIQNDLEEFYAIAEFVNPGVLGPVSSFRKIYVEPITFSQNPECTDEEKELGEARAAHLGKMVSAFFLRRTQDVINKYLPPKSEFIVFCRPTELQCRLYEHVLQSREVQSVLTCYSISGGSSPLQFITVLRKICNHPSLLYSCSENFPDDQEISDGSILEYMQSAFPENYTFEFHHSGKMKVTAKILHEVLTSRQNEKIVIVSNFTQTLDIFENLCKAKSYSFVRLDGSTNSSSRLNIVEKFNSPFSKERIFLLSSKAGGAGLNLIGASRIILYDIDWNPATDLQAMSRVWRDGQKRQVYVYRLLTAGSIEEKMFQRQVCKQGLSGTVIEVNSNSGLRFSREELKDLFTFHKDCKCLVHDSINCPCLDPGYYTGGEEEEKAEIRSCQLGWLRHSNQPKNTSMSELLKWQHIMGPLPEDKAENSYLRGNEDVTFLFVNKVNFAVAKA